MVNLFVSFSFITVRGVSGYGNTYIKAEKFDEENARMLESTIFNANLEQYCELCVLNIVKLDE